MCTRETLDNFTLFIVPYVEIQDIVFEVWKIHLIVIEIDQRYL